MNIGKIILTLSLFLLTACKEYKENSEFNGEINLIKSMQLQSNNNLIVLNIPKYQARLKLNSNSFILNLPNSDFNNTFIFNHSLNLDSIKSGDNIHLFSKDSGQPVNLVGKYTEDHSISDVIKEYEACQFLTQDNHCHAAGINKPGCQNEYATGRKYVEYQKIFNMKKINFNIYSATTNEIVGTLTADDGKFDKKYSYTEDCHIN